MRPNVDLVIGTAVTAWTAALLVVVPAGRPEVFAILVLIGLLVVRALAGPYTSAPTNHRIDAFVYFGLALFAVFVIQRVFDVLSGA